MEVLSTRTCLIVHSVAVSCLYRPVQVGLWIGERSKKLRRLETESEKNGFIIKEKEGKNDNAGEGIGMEHREGAEELSPPQKCAICGRMCLLWNARNGNYECLNPDCQAVGKTPDTVFSWKLVVGKISGKREETQEHVAEQQEGKQEHLAGREEETQPVPKLGASPIESSTAKIGQHQNTGGKPMLVKLTYVLLIVFFVAAIVWGLVNYNNLLKARSELNAAAETVSTYRTLIGTLETDLETAKNDLAKTQGDLASVRQELSSAKSKIELYEDTWGLVASGVQPPFRDTHIVSYETATDPTWAELLDFLRDDKTDENIYVPGEYVCSHFAVDVHNNAERAGIRAAYVVVELPGSSHALNAFKTTDRGLVFIDCTGLHLGEPGPSNRDKTVNVRMGRSYVAESLFPESGWSVTWKSKGTVSDVQIYW